MNITSSEFASMTEAERAVLTYEMLSNMSENITDLKASVDTLAKCVNDGLLTDTETTAKIVAAQKMADDALATGKSAHKRIDKIIWAVAGTALGALVSIILALITYLIQRGIA